MSTLNSLIHSLTHSLATRVLLLFSLLTCLSVPFSFSNSLSPTLFSLPLPLSPLSVTHTHSLSPLTLTLSIYLSIYYLLLPSLPLSVCSSKSQDITTSIRRLPPTPAAPTFSPPPTEVLPRTRKNQFNSTFTIYPPPPTDSRRQPGKLSIIQSINRYYCLTVLPPRQPISHRLHSDLSFSPVPFQS